MNSPEQPETTDAEMPPDAALLAVACCIQSWHCYQTDVPPPCSDDCSCWQSAKPVIAAYERAMAGGKP